MARSFYQQHLSPSPNWFVAILFYLLLIKEILFFVVVPGLESGSLKATVRAVLFGLISYATYNLTNLATLKDRPVMLSMLDTLWGTFISVSVSAVGFIADKRIS